MRLQLRLHRHTGHILRERRRLQAALPLRGLPGAQQRLLLGQDERPPAPVSTNRGLRGLLGLSREQRHESHHPRLLEGSKPRPAVLMRRRKRLHGEHHREPLQR